MFSGIIEQTSRLLDFKKNGSVYQIFLEKPESFDDLKVGDSISTNGACLTIEKFDNRSMQFSLGPETLEITNFSQKLVPGEMFNLERSIRFGDRVHGHLVTGHVDGVGKVVGLNNQTESLLLSIQIPWKFKKFVWPKGAVCLSGVSLTINDVEGDVISFCLIPETLLRTNLKNLKMGEDINLEFDYMAKAVIHSRELST